MPINWVVDEEERVFKEYQMLSEGGLLIVPNERNWERAQLILPKERRRGRFKSPQASEHSKRYRYWLANGEVPPKNYDKKPTVKKPTVKVSNGKGKSGPVTQAIGEAAQAMAADPAHPLSVSEIVDQIIERNKLPWETNQPVAGTLDAIFYKMIGSQVQASVLPVAIELKEQINVLLKDHEKVVEGMFADFYDRIIGYFEAPSKPQVAVRETIVELKPSIEVQHMVHNKPSKPKVYISGAPTIVTQIKRDFPWVDIENGDSHNPRSSPTGSSYDMVIATKWTNHPETLKMADRYKAKFIFMRKGGVTGLKKIINDNFPKPNPPAAS